MLKQVCQVNTQHSTSQFSMIFMRFHQPLRIVLCCVLCVLIDLFPKASQEEYVDLTSPPTEEPVDVGIVRIVRESIPSYLG